MHNIFSKVIIKLRTADMCRIVPGTRCIVCNLIIYIHTKATYLFNGMYTVVLKYCKKKI